MVGFFGNVEDNILYLIAICWSGLCSLIAICVLISTFYQLIMKDASEWINEKYRNLTLWAILYFDQKEATLKACVSFIYYSANIVFYLLLLIRIHVAFKLNKCIVYYLSMLILIAMISSIIFCYWLLSFPGREDIQKLAKYLFYTNIPLSVAALMLNVMLFVIFWYKMKKSIVGIKYNTDTENYIDLILNVTTKHIVLFGFAIIINQSFFSYVYYWTHKLRYHIENINSINDATTIYILRAAECVTNVFVLWLILRINYNKYICCCKSCHFCIGKCCMNIHGDPIINPYTRLNDVQLKVKYTATKP
eukprot:534052_1